MMGSDRPTARALSVVGYHFDHMWSNRQYLLDYLLQTLDIRQRPRALGAVVQRQFYCLVYMVRLLAIRTRMPHLSPGTLVLLRRDLLWLFPTKRSCLAGHLSLGFFQFLTQLPILLLEFLDSLLQASDLGLQFLYDYLCTIIHSQPWK